MLRLTRVRITKGKPQLKTLGRSLDELGKFSGNAAVGSALSDDVASGIGMAAGIAAAEIATRAGAKLGLVGKGLAFTWAWFELAPAVQTIVSLELGGLDAID